MTGFGARLRFVPVTAEVGVDVVVVLVDDVSVVAVDPAIEVMC